MDTFMIMLKNVLIFVLLAVPDSFAESSLPRTSK